jgi:hypothetical protein
MVGFINMMRLFMMLFRLYPPFAMPDHIPYVTMHGAGVKFHQKPG